MDEQDDRRPDRRRSEPPIEHLGGDDTDPATPQPDPPAGAEHDRPRAPVTQQIGRAVVLLLVVLVGVFAASNAHRVDFSWVLGATRVVEGPGDEVQGGVHLIVLLLVSFVVGVIVGALLLWQSSRTRRAARGDRPARGDRAARGDRPARSDRPTRPPRHE